MTFARRRIQDGGSWKDLPQVKLQRMNRRALTLGALAVSGALALTACGSDDTGSKEGGSTSSATAAAGDIKCDDAKGQLLADGSSAQKNAIDAWVKNFTQACNGVQVNYKAPVRARASPRSPRARSPSPVPTPR